MSGHSSEGTARVAAILRLYDEPYRDGYPEPWVTKAIPNLVREQAGHRCIRCGHPYRKGEHGNGHWSPCDDRCNHRGSFRFKEGGAWLPGSVLVLADEDADPTPGELVISGYEVEADWRILTVHHLNGDKLDCRWWNLTALCQRCHLTIQGKVVMERRFLTEHSEWFRPYVAAWYAWDRLGEDLTREETMARLGELLALEDRQLVLGRPR